MCLICIYIYTHIANIYIEKEKNNDRVRTRVKQIFMFFLACQWQVCSSICSVKGTKACLWVGKRIHIYIYIYMYIYIYTYRKYIHRERKEQ